MKFAVCSSPTSQPEASTARAPASMRRCGQSVHAFAAGTIPRAVRQPESTRRSAARPSAAISGALTKPSSPAPAASASALRPADRSSTRAWVARCTMRNSPTRVRLSARLAGSIPQAHVGPVGVARHGPHFPGRRPESSAVLPLRSNAVRNTCASDPAPLLGEAGVAVCEYRGGTGPPAAACHRRAMTDADGA